MMRPLAVLVCSALIVAGGASAARAQTTRVILVGGSAAATVGTPWRATLVVRRASAGRPTVTLHGASVRPAAVRRAAPGRYRLVAVFPTAGRWRVVARLGGRRFLLRSVIVRARAPSPITLQAPVQMGLDAAGNLLVTENERSRVVRIDPATGRLTVIAAVASPYGLAVDGSGGLYTSSDDRLVRIAADGSTTVVARSEGGSDIGPVIVDDGGDVFFVAGGRIYRLPRGSGSAVRYGGTGNDGYGGDGGPVEDATFGRPHGLAFGRDGALIVSDSENGRVRRVDPVSRVVSTLASGFRFPAGIAAGSDGSVYVAEDQGNTVRRVAPDGTVTPVAGTGASGSTGDGGPATSATLAGPFAVAVASDGTAYVTEVRSGRIRRIDAAGRISTLSQRR